MSQPDNRTTSKSAAHAPVDPEWTASDESVADIVPMRRLVGAIASPNETFKEINRKPTWIAPVIIAALTMMAGNAFYYWRVNPDWEQRVLTRIEQHRETTGQVMTPDQVQQQITFAKTMGRFFILLPVINVPVFCLAMAGIYMLGFGMLFLATPSKFRSSGTKRARKFTALQTDAGECLAYIEAARAGDDRRVPQSGGVEQETG